MKKDLIITALLAFCLAGVLFTAIPTNSQETLEYDPWKDVNDDGKIDILDVTSLTGIYGAEGTPINKTEILLELLGRITYLEEQVEWLHNFHPAKPHYVNWTNGPVGYWNLNEGIGTIAYDISNYRNNGTLYGPTWTNGVYGNALSFDGTNDYVEVPQNPSLDIVDGVSVAAWIHPKALPASGVILSRWYDGTEPDRGIVLQLLPGFCHFGVIDDNNRLLVPFSFEINKWYFLAATWNGSVSRVYVNGIEIGNRSTSGSFTNQNLNLGIGSDLNPFEWYFNGIIDNVMIYNRALTEEEVLAHYICPPP